MKSWMKFKPCPFCGASGPACFTVHKLGNVAYVSCQMCEAVGPSASQKTRAVRKWNERKEKQE